MKKNWFYYVFLSVSLVFSCTSNTPESIIPNGESIEKPSLILNQSDENEVSLQEANQIAIEFGQTAIDGKNLRGNGNDKPKKVKKTIEIKDEKDNTNAMYVIDYEEGGFLVLSGDKRMTPILAFSDEGMSGDTALGGVKEWISFSKKAIQTVKEKYKTPKAEILDQWNRYDANKKVEQLQVAPTQ